MNRRKRKICRHTCARSSHLRGEDRHWMLDWSPARQLLKTLLRKRRPYAGVPIYGYGAKFDYQLDALIIELGMTDLELPDEPWDRMCLAYRFFWLMLQAEFGKDVFSKPAQDP